MSKEVSNNRISIRMTNEEIHKLNVIVSELELPNKSDVVRLLIDSVYDRLGNKQIS